MHDPAKEPNDLERLFVERANAGDVEIRLQKAETRNVRMCVDQARQDRAAATVDTSCVGPGFEELLVPGREHTSVIVDNQYRERDDAVVA